MLFNFKHTHFVTFIEVILHARFNLDEAGAGDETALTIFGGYSIYSSWLDRELSSSLISFQPTSN